MFFKNSSQKSFCFSTSATGRAFNSLRFPTETQSSFLLRTAATTASLHALLVLHAVDAATAATSAAAATEQLRRSFPPQIRRPRRQLHRSRDQPVHLVVPPQVKPPAAAAPPVPRPPQQPSPAARPVAPSRHRLERSCHVAAFQGSGAVGALQEAQRECSLRFYVFSIVIQNNVFLIFFQFFRNLMRAVRCCLSFYSFLFVEDHLFYSTRFHVPELHENPSSV